MRYGAGWHRDSYRHYLAAKYGSAGRYKKKRGTAHGIPIFVDKLEDGKVYPLSPAEVKKRIEQMPVADVKGLKKIEFVNPKGEQKDAWAQYVRSRKSLLIFSQKHDEPGVVDGQDADYVNKHMKEYVIPHEVGHHRALYHMKKTDKSLAVAEARADANVVGLHPLDRDVKKLV